MVTTIQIDENTKELLDRLKIHYRQSYNELIATILEEKMRKNGRKNIMDLAGTWKNINDDEIEKMKENIHQLRKHSTAQLLRKMEKQ